jgi:hypothetical protein
MEHLVMSAAESIPQTSLAHEVECHVRQYTHGRIRNLVVEEDKGGMVMVSGEVRTWHAKQLALQGALELLSGDQFRERITVVRST